MHDVFKSRPLSTPVAIAEWHSNSPELDSIYWVYCQIVQRHRQKCRPSCYLSCRYPVGILWHDILNSERLCNLFPDSIIPQDNNKQVQHSHKPTNSQNKSIHHNPSIVCLPRLSGRRKISTCLEFLLISSWYWSSLPFAWLVVYRNYSSPQCKAFLWNNQKNAQHLTADRGWSMVILGVMWLAHGCK